MGNITLPHLVADGEGRDWDYSNNLTIINKEKNVMDSSRPAIGGPRFFHQGHRSLEWLMLSLGFNKKLFA